MTKQECLDEIDRVLDTLGTEDGRCGTVSEFRADVGFVPVGDLLQSVVAAMKADVEDDG